MEALKDLYIVMYVEGNYRLPTLIIFKIKGVKMYNTDNYSEILMYCPYCGELNHIQTYYATGSTTGILYCVHCGAKL